MSNSHDGFVSTSSHDVSTAVTPRTDLIGLAFAVALPVLLVHLFVVKPATTHLNELRGQVARMEISMNELKQQTPAANGSASLLVSLTEQEQTLTRAEAALDRMATLQRRLAVGLDQVEHSVALLDRLDQFRDKIDEQVAVLGAANDSLTALAMLPEELQAAVDQASKAAPAVQQVESLRDRLSEANRITSETAEKLEHVVEKQAGVLVSVSKVAEANRSLDALVRLESRLNSPMLAPEIANERLGSLLTLKESLLDETENLPEAFETLELMVALNDDLQKASAVFGPLKRLITNLVLLEPSIARVAHLMEPIMEQASIARLGGPELRLVLQELRRRHAEAATKLERNVVETKSAKTEPAEAESDVASLPKENDTK